MPGLRLEGKHAVVSGGAAGAGGAASEVFAREGAHVFIVDIQEDANRIFDNGIDVLFNYVGTVPGQRRGKLCQRRNHVR